MTISDLTKDTRPRLEDMLTDAIHDTVDIDKSKANGNGDEVEYENTTFYYRVIFLFMQRVVRFYSNEEIEKWSKTTLLKETLLPKIDKIRK